MIFATMFRLAAFSWMSKLLTACCNFGTIILLSQYLGASERGICAWYAVLVAISLLITDVVAGGTVVYLMQRNDWRTIRSIYIPWAGAVAFVVMLAAWGANSIEIAEATSLIAIAFFNALFSFHNHVLLGLKQFRLFNISTVAAAAALLMVAFGLLQTGFGRFGYLMAMLLVWLFAAAIQYVQLQRISPVSAELSKNRLGLFKQMISTGFTNQMVQLLGLANNRFPFFWMKAGMLGSFSNSLALAEAMMLLPGSIGQVYYSQHAGKVPMVQDYRRFAKLLVLNLGILSIAVMLVQIIPDNFYMVLFGAGFSGIGEHLKLLSFSMLFYGMYMMLSYWQSARGKFSINLWCTLLSLCTTCLFAFVSFVQFGWQLNHLVSAVAAGLIISGLSAVLFFGMNWRSASIQQRKC